MFTVIEPTEHNYDKKLIKPFLDHIQNNPRLKGFFEDHQKATFIIFVDESKDIYGGAMLLKKANADLHKSAQKNMLNLGSLHKDIWTCTLFLRPENNCFSQHFEFFFETFYRDLYKKLVEIGVKENTSFLYTMLEPCEYLCTEALGGWPYIFKGTPDESSDGLCHNILSLVSNPFQFCIKNGVTRGCKEIKLAAQPPTHNAANKGEI